MYPETLRIEPTKRSPLIQLEQGRLFILGRSIVENPAAFYEPVHTWINSYARQWKGSTKVILGFEYINTGSIKWLYILLRTLNDMKDLQISGTMTWYYEEGDDDMFELGHIIKSLIDTQFTINEVDLMNDPLYKSIISQNP
jgi:hypothetical protein